MDRYASMYSDVYSVFSSTAWVTAGVKTVPENYTASGIGNEYIRVSVLFGGGYGYVNLPSSQSGQLIIDIFAPAGEGMKKLSTIADKLNSFLERKTVGYTQFSTSSFSPLGLDAANASLYRGKYSISFNYFRN